ncbi:MerR family transcriptional regulator [Nonomuraea dietziae]|uniref:MerR family transcriptional regulator n=1 Tax=Nonomuraea dietziae TaxID=65515 RepID=UPI003420F01A
MDGEPGYRFYDPAQLERARLIAWLRRLGMALARIQCRASGRRAWPGHPKSAFGAALYG